MSGKAMLTIVTSSNVMKTPTEVTSKTCQRRAITAAGRAGRRVRRGRVRTRSAKPIARAESGRRGRLAHQGGLGRMGETTLLTSIDGADADGSASITCE